MSSCTIGVVKDNRFYLVIEHYSYLKAIFNDEQSYIKESNPQNVRGCLNSYPYESNTSDTGFIPAVIINFDDKVVIDTDYNWFIGMEELTPKGWKYQHKGVR